MREREDIEENFEWKFIQNELSTLEQIRDNQGLLLEVLLDIRDLMKDSGPRSSEEEIKE